MFREAVIAEQVRGRKTLDVGSLGQTDAYRLWDVLDRHAGSLTGIDLDEAALAKLGFPDEGQAPPDPRILRGDVESHDFGERWRVADIINNACSTLDVDYPVLPEEALAELETMRRHLMDEDQD